MNLQAWWRGTRRTARGLAARGEVAARRALHGVERLPRRPRRVLLGTAIVLAVLFAAVALLDVLIDAPLRASIERRMNAALDGYTVRLGSADFSPWDFSLELRDLVVTQDAHPEPAVLDLPDFRFSVQWRALLLLRLVADAELDRPRLYVNLAQLREERRDRMPLERRGWQRALEQAYPLKINELRIVDGVTTYVDERSPDRPLELSRLDAVAQNIRNVRSPERVYPSTFHATAAVFGSGSAALDGRANFLAEPFPAVAADGQVDAVPLDRLQPIVQDYRLTVRRGRLSARGSLEYGPRRRRVSLDDVEVAGVRIDYLSDPELTRRAVAAVREAKRQQRTAVDVRRVHLVGSELGFVNQAKSPGYRVFADDTELTLTGWSNDPHAPPSHVTARGAFMGSGRAAASGVFRQDTKGADFAIAVAIEGTRLTAMNDLLRSYANLDVTGGTFSFYSQLRVKDGKLDGYVKPLFREVDVYAPEQDKDEGVFHQLWEKLAEGVSELLENRPNEEVATVVDLSGSVSDPHSSNLQVVLNLIKNAFVKAILPGFRRHAKGR